MGLASSQARLLSLTSRMHQIEYKAAKLEAFKLQMANESDKVYNDYLDALETTKVQRKVLTSEGAVSYKDIDNYKTDFLDNNFAIAFNNVIYGSNAKTNADNSVFVMPSDPVTVTVTEDNKDDLIAQTGIVGLTAGDVVNTYKDYYTGEPVYSNGPIAGLTEVDAFALLAHDAFNADLAAPPVNVKEVITNLINSGQCVIVTKEPIEDWDPEFMLDPAHLTSVSTNTNLQEVSDDVNLRKAEAKYEADMRKIDGKERYYDQQLSALEQERNAIKQEMETLKTVAKDNVERTFKLFG